MIPHSSSSRCYATSGAALVMVLSVLILVSGLVVALLNLATGERKSASVFLVNEGIRQLSDDAVGIVQAQINHATTRGTGAVWASQPGMIRTYKQNGAFDTAYKLYSAGSLTESNIGALGYGDYPPADWASSPAIWSDLNAPVDVDGRNVYPIVDPAILNLPSSERPQGFDIAAAPGSTSGQPAPMPVCWLYVLQNGQIVAPTFSGTTVSIPQATDSNPVKGRIAFWTDDESCKVNLNTSGCGATGANSGFWDTPHYNTVEDQKFATSQPVNGEFQRYPGHPAMTSLSAVFPTLSDTNILSTITPRYQWGGSAQGTTDTVFGGAGLLKTGSLATGPLYADTDELIFIPDISHRSKNPNLTRDQVAQAKFFLTADSRAPEVNLFDLPRVACWPIHADLALNPASPYTTAFDRLIARCSSTGSGASINQYYFQRKNALSPTDDANISRNKDLFGYLQYLTNQAVPGFGVSLSGKFGADRDQILTEIWDYIRCSNLADSRLASGMQFTADTSTGANTPGYGYVVPLENGTSKGLGRTLTVTELAFIFICTADPVDTQTGSGHPDPNGMMGSNVPSQNLTLGGTKLNSNQRRVQMMILPKFFSPSMGDINIIPKNIRITITGLGSLSIGGNSLFSNNSRSRMFSDFGFNSGWHHRTLGGTYDYRSFLDGQKSSAGRSLDHDPGIIDTGAPVYPFISNFVTISVPNPPHTDGDNPGTMAFSAGRLTVTIETSTDNVTWHTSQSISIAAPLSTQIPIPNLVRTGSDFDAAPPAGGGSLVPATNPQCWWAFSNNGPCPAMGGTCGRLAYLWGHPGSYSISGGIAIEGTPGSNSTRGGTLIRGAEKANSNYYTDVVRSMALAHGDARLTCAMASVQSPAFSAMGQWSNTGSPNAVIHTLSTGFSIAQYVPGSSQYRRHFVTTNSAGTVSNVGSGGAYAPDFRNDLSSSIYKAVLKSGDFDTAPAFWADGSYINKPDEGNVYSTGSSTPYFTHNESEKLDSTGYFSPNRIIPGPGMFGSLPTHVQRYAKDVSHPENYAWRTLLFRKQPTHPDAVTVSSGGVPNSSAPDHLLMDLFWMPTVEPYAISEPFSTAGKVNMNYQIQPFSYIKRPTGMYAILQREKITAVTNDATTYAVYKDANTAANISLRNDINIQETLKQFENRFGDPSGRLFISPTELCDLWLVPNGENLGSMDAFWTSHNLTGDNMRERPYTTIIPRLTTKSNTYTVHYRVQTLQQVRQGRKTPTDWATWTEGRDLITGEYRGSTTIQRFIDLENATLQTTDFDQNTASVPTLGTFYRWRVINTKQFAP